MKELIYQIGNKPIEGPELFPKRAVLEGLSPQMLDDFIADCHHKKQELDELIKLAIDVKEAGYGCECGDAA